MRGGGGLVCRDGCTQVSQGPLFFKSRCRPKINRSIGRTECFHIFFIPSRYTYTTLDQRYTNEAAVYIKYHVPMGASNRGGAMYNTRRLSLSDRAVT